MDVASLLRDILDDAKYEEIRELAAGSPGTDSSIPPRDGSCAWSLLPRELRDVIFEYTYAQRSGNLKILFKSEIDLYKGCDTSTRLLRSGNRKVSLINPVHTYIVVAQQPWWYGGFCTTLTVLNSFCIPTITSIDSSFASNGHPKPPRPCSPPPSYASRCTSQEPSPRHSA